MGHWRDPISRDWKRWRGKAGTRFSPQGASPAWTTFAGSAPSQAWRGGAPGRAPAKGRGPPPRPAPPRGGGGGGRGPGCGDRGAGGDPAEVAERYDREGADELVFLDITASAERRKILIGVVEQTAERAFTPLPVGGGIRELEDIRALLLAGADKVSLNTAAVENPSLIRGAAERFGSQCIVLAIDAKRRPFRVQGSGCREGPNHEPSTMNSERTA